jgi:hypothetical protein
VTGLRKNLLELLLSNGNGTPVFAEHDRSAGGRALVEGENAIGHQR